MASVDRLLKGRDICICVGTGGVGKTTTSAAIALGMAGRGLKVCVLTIDPAKRLADSLGMEELGNEARRVGPELLAEHGIEPAGGGELWAMMLDAKATFDELVGTHAPDEASRDRVLENPIYQQISSALAGSQEYMAMEKLFELHSEGRFDLLVLDTPPTRNALDFLDAPQRLTQFIEGRSLRVFMKPSGFAAKVAGRGTSMALGVLKRIVGFDLLADLQEFFTAFSGMVDGFRERAKRVSELLSAPGTTFLVVCGPRGEPVEEAVYFHRKLSEARLPFGGVIVNKVHYPAEELADGDPEAVAGELVDALRAGGAGGAGGASGGGASGGGTSGGGAGGAGGDEGALNLEQLADKVAENLHDYQVLAERDAAGVRRIRAEMRTRAVIRVPYLDHDVHDLAALAEVNRYLFATESERTALAGGKRP